MRIEVVEGYRIVLKEVYSGVLMETSEGNRIGICMRDDTFEINVLPKGCKNMNWHRVNMQTGKIEKRNCLNRTLKDLPRIIKRDSGNKEITVTESEIEK